MSVNTLTVVIGVICSLLGVWLGVMGCKRNLEKDSKDDGQGKGVMLTELGYIKAGIDDIKRKQDGQEDKHNHLAERVTRVEESAKQAHHRIDRIQKEGD